MGTIFNHIIKILLVSSFKFEKLNIKKKKIRIVLYEKSITQFTFKFNNKFIQNSGFGMQF